MDADFTLRRDAPADTRAVETLTREAFWNLHGPGCDEHYLVHILRESDDCIAALDIVAEVDGVIVGSILYTKSYIALDSGGTLPVITFGPVTVLPKYQRQGIGRALISHTLALAKQMGYPAVLIYGDPAYYGRLGFQPAEQYGIGTDDDFYHAALQAFILQPGALDHAAGRFVEAQVYHIDATAAAAFDRSFPPKEKQTGTPSQLRFQQIVAMRRPRIRKQ